MIGSYTNEIVYERLAPGVMDELRHLNPVLPDKSYRQHKHHQWLTRDIGHRELERHLSAVIALMRAASSWNVFRRMLDSALPKLNETIPLQLDEPEP